MIGKKKEILFLCHRVDTKGGQERSSLEVLSRLAKKGHQISIVSNVLEGWPQGVTVNWKKAPASPFKIQLLKNLWMALYFSIVYFKERNKKIVMTIGISSWFADIRIIQFLHPEFLKAIEAGHCPYPNNRTKLHELYQHLFLKWTIFLERTFFKKTKFFIAISHRIKKEIIDLNHDAKVFVIHHALDNVAVSNDDNEQNNLKRLNFNILFVGALERKGIEAALKILAKTNKTNWHFDVLGNGNIDKWKTLASDLGIEKKVTFHGMKPSFDFFQSADILLFPSIYEPFGLVVSEAASHRVVPLASLECGAMELWNKRDPWLNLSSKQPLEFWVNALNRILDDAQLLKTLKTEAYQAFAAWNWDQAAEKYEEVIFGK